MIDMPGSDRVVNILEMGLRLQYRFPTSCIHLDIDQVS
jgi:hypothetical protein